MKHVAFLSIVFVLLVLGVIVRESSRPDAGNLRDEVPLEPLAVAAFELAEVARIDVTPPSGDGFFLSTMPEVETWTVTGKFAAPASRGAVEKLIQDVIDARGELRLDDEAALAKFDLTQDRATRVTVRGFTNEVLADFAIGLSSGDTGAFVRLLHDPEFSESAYAVPQDLRGDLGLARTRADDVEPHVPSATHFHDLQLPSVANMEVDRVEIETPLWSVAVIQTGTGWTIAEGGLEQPQRRANILSMVRTLVSGVQAAQLVDPTERTKLGLDEPNYRITTYAPNGEPRSLLASADHDAGEFHVRLGVERDPDVIYSLSSYNFALLFPQGSNLFDMDGMTIDDAGVGRIVIERKGATPIEIASGTGADLGNWRVVSPQWPLATNAREVQTISRLLGGVRPVDWSTAAPTFDPDVTIRFGGPTASDSELSELRIGGATATGIHRLAVLPDSPDRTMVVPDSAVERLAPDALSLFEPRPLHGWESRFITGVTVRSPGGEARFAVARSEDDSGNERWQLEVTDGEPGRALTSLVDAWLDDLLALAVTDVLDAAPAVGTEIEITRESGAPLVLGLVPGEDDALSIVLAGMGFRALGDDLVPDPETLRATESDEDADDSGDDAPGDDTTDEE